MCLAIPAQIESIDEILDETFRTAKVSFGGVKKSINLALVPEAKVGDFVLVHVGVALSKIDEEEALKVFQTLKELGELDELEGQTSFDEIP